MRDGLADHRAVPVVDAVEDADRHDRRRLVARHVLEPLPALHAPILPAAHDPAPTGSRVALLE